jgi:hypothetical protein
MLGRLIPAKACNVAVLTNQTCDATQGRSAPEGVRTRTLWGELALQLGVRAGRGADTNAVGPTLPNRGG